MIIYRYLCKEIFTALMAVISVLLLIFLSRQLVRYLAQAAAGKLSAALLSKLLLLQIPHLLGWLLPPALFLAILLTYSRMYVENEMTALFACGFSFRQLFSATTIVAVVITCLVAMITLGFGPQINLANDQLMQQSKSAAVIEFMQPGRFKESTNGKHIYYVEGISRDRQRLKAVFVAQAIQSSDQSQPNNHVIMTAKKGEVVIDQQSRDRFLVLTDGYRYAGTPGQSDYSIMQFNKYKSRLSEAPITSSTDSETFSTSMVWQTAKQEPRMNAELQWRFSFPLSTLVLAWLAIPLSHVRPRQGRYAHLLPAILLYVIYVNLFLLGRSWLGHDKVPAWIGLWWVHGLVIMLTFWMVGKAHIPMMMQMIRKKVLR